MPVIEESLLCIHVILVLQMEGKVEECDSVNEVSVRM